MLMPAAMLALPHRLGLPAALRRAWLHCRWIRRHNRNYRCDLLRGRAKLSLWGRLFWSTFCA